MKATYLILTFALIICGAGTVVAAGDLTAQTPIEVKVQLGSKENALRFFPDKIVIATIFLQEIACVLPFASMYVG